MPFFSIVIPTYNRADFLEKTIDSVLQQSFQDFEILVVDDGSTDNTNEIVRNISDSRVHYHFKENEERGAARNYGFDKSEGEYVVFLDSDDLFSKEHLSTLNEHLAKKQEKFICTRYDFVDEKGLRRNSPMSLIKSGYHNYLLFLQGNPLGCNICVLRSNPDFIPFRKERKYASMEDWIFNLENLRSSSLMLLEATTVTMNDHGNRSMQSNHQLLIERRKKATNYLKINHQFNRRELKKLEGQTHYFCAIHQYIDGRTKMGLIELAKSTKYLGINMQLFLLLIKLLVGHKIVNKVKDWI